MTELNPRRLVSLDAFRGFTIAAMLLVNNPGDWEHVYAPLDHAEWNGWTFTDLVFPFFLFISGVSMHLSLQRRLTIGQTRASLWRDTTRRAAVIFLVGVALNWSFLFEWQHLRVPGVLQRIGLCTLLAAPILLFSRWRVQLGAVLALLGAYTALMLLVPVPDAAGLWHTGSQQPGEDTGAWLDRQLLGGHLWAKAKTWDPEGLLGTLPALAGMLLGALCGQWLQAAREPGRRIGGMLVCGLGLIAAGALLGEVSMPINKSLWTPAYTLLTTGWALCAFAGSHLLLDVAPPRMRDVAQRLALPLVIFGMNALFLFTLSGLVGRALVFIHGPADGGAPLTLKAMLYAPIRALPLAAATTSLVYAMLFCAAMFAVAWWMWRRRWFVKV